MNRSYLFVPADSERKLSKSTETGADALILDLEDSVAAEARPAARKLAVEFLQDTPAWVRINPIDSADAALDLGMGEANKLLSKQVARKKLTPEKAGAILSTIRPSCQSATSSSPEMATWPRSNSIGSVMAANRPPSGVGSSRGRSAPVARSTATG